MPRLFQKKEVKEETKIPEPPAPEKSSESSETEEKITVVTENWLLNNKIDYLVNRIDYITKLIEDNLK